MRQFPGFILRSRVWLLREPRRRLLIFGGYLGPLLFERLPALDLGQCLSLVLAEAPGNFTGKSTFSEVAAGNAIGMLLQVRLDPIGVPCTAVIVTDNRVKQIATIAVAGTIPHDLFDMLNGVAAAVDDAADAFLCRLSLITRNIGCGLIEERINVRQFLGASELLARYG
jgi:hypothetical protein